MGEDHLYIKNMVCDRCIKAVSRLLQTQQIPFNQVTLGEIILSAPLSSIQKKELAKALAKEGFELLDDQQSRLISQIKSLLINLIHHEDLTELHENISRYLSERLHKDYNYLSNQFSISQNVTIEQFVIYQKIEKVKELLVYDELTLSEIAYKLGYSSVAHLSAQFKKVTGFTPTQFKKIKHHKRKALDKI